MAVPENATKLGTVGIAYKGVYDELATYKYANAVYYNGSTYIALIDNPAGFPSNDGVNWRYLAQGFLQQAISALTVIDESGILGEVDAEVNAQEFLSKIAELEQGLEDTKANKADVLDSLEEIIANTEEGRIAGANALSELNSNLSDVANGYKKASSYLDAYQKAKSELLITFDFVAAGNAICLTLIIPKSAISTNAYKFFLTGAYYNASTVYFAQIRCYAGGYEVGNATAYVNGTAVSTTLGFYYK